MANRRYLKKTGPGIAEKVGTAHYKGNGLGFAANAIVPKRKASLGIKYFREVDSGSTFQGYTLQIPGSIKFWLELCLLRLPPRSQAYGIESDNGRKACQRKRQNVDQKKSLVRAISTPVEENENEYGGSAGDGTPIHQ
jgi:hypothetical protein